MVSADPLGAATHFGGTVPMIARPRWRARASMRRRHGVMTRSVSSALSALLRRRNSSWFWSWEATTHWHGEPRTTTPTTRATDLVVQLPEAIIQQQLRGGRQLLEAPTVLRVVTDAIGVRPKSAAAVQPTQSRLEALVDGGFQLYGELCRLHLVLNFLLQHLSHGGHSVFTRLRR